MMMMPQAALGFTGLLIVTIYVLATDAPAHALTSQGFALDLGDGLVARTPGYSGPVDCKDPVTEARTCDNFAYAAGDMAVNTRGMTDVDAYAPFPNAILMNCEWPLGPAKQLA
jgi:hypothetical protein